MISGRHSALNISIPRARGDGKSAHDRSVELTGRVTVCTAARGSGYLIGRELSALDIYFATFYSLIEPMAPELCPMATGYRPSYENHDPDIARAATPALAAHRYSIYREHLVCPSVF